MKLNIPKKFLWPLADSQLAEMFDANDRGTIRLNAATVDRIVDIFRRRSHRIERLIRRRH
jgi:hypothetical protein